MQAAIKSRTDEQASELMSQNSHNISQVQYRALHGIKTLMSEVLTRLRNCGLTLPTNTDRESTSSLLAWDAAALAGSTHMTR